MATGDAAYIKEINKSIIVREIVRHQVISRASLAKITKLTRATISSQIAALIDEGLIVESSKEHNSVGRRPIMLSINEHAGYAMGIDLNYDNITFTITNLLGQPIKTEIHPTNKSDYKTITQLLIKRIKHLLSQYTNCRYEIIGIGIAIHGLVTKDGMINYIPGLDWREKNLLHNLETEIHVPIYIENNANLSALAEHVYVYHQTDNIMSISLYSGIGLGLIINNDFFHGHDGFAGEVGHMIVVPNGQLCECGNNGCWEMYASEASVIKRLSRMKHQPNITYEDIQEWIQSNDMDTHTVLNDFIYYLALGLNNMINTYNPDIITLDSYLLDIIPNALNRVKAHLHSTINHYQQLHVSTIQQNICALGACALVIKHFLNVPVLSFNLNKSK